MKWLDDLFNKHKLVRRATLAWACWLITVVALRVTEPEALQHVSGAVATVVTAVIGILATVISFYVTARNKEDRG